MLVGVPKETFPGEQRVALVPAVLPALQKLALEVVVEHGAGEAAGFSDGAYEELGACVAGRADVFARADLIVQVRGPGANPNAGRRDFELLRAGQALIALLEPLKTPELIHELAARRVTAFALELIPRITRAQNMDVLSSTATVVGYKAVLMAATVLPKMFPMMITAAGTVTPARVFVIGAGVAGLQAIATAHRLGAVVTAYDVRPGVRQEVESLGARFLTLPLETTESEAPSGYAKAFGEEFYARQRQLMAQALTDSDVVITSAAVPGMPAPRLITTEMVRGMPHGSVIVDLAANAGGNCELTRIEQTVQAHGVTILGPVNVASTVPYHASQMFARNVTALLKHLIRDGKLHCDVEDPIVRAIMITHAGEVVAEKIRDLVGR
jgi:NAD(P) transhydrogenase subunit alpha